MSLPRDGSCIHCQAKVNWYFARPEDPCLECGLPVGEKDGLDQKIDTSIAAVNLTNRAGFIVADEVNKVMEKAITAGWEGGVQEIRKAFPTIKPEKIEAMLRRQIHVELVKIHTEAASAWDDVLFMGHSPRFEPPNPDDPHGGDDPHGHQ